MCGKNRGGCERYFVTTLSISGRIYFSKATPLILLYGYLMHRTIKWHNYYDFIIRQINVQKIKHLKNCKRHPSANSSNQTFSVQIFKISNCYSTTDITSDQK